jgi:hypothetical protein
MADDEKEGYYCTICGGIPLDQIKIKKISMNGKEKRASTGLNGS